MDPFFQLKSRLQGDIYVKPELEHEDPQRGKEPNSQSKSHGVEVGTVQSGQGETSSYTQAESGHRDDTDHPYLLSLALFNKAIRSQALAVIRPKSVQDVVETVRFVRERGYTISVKGGGHGTAGWAVEGQIVIDLCQMTRCDIAMNDEESHTHPSACNPAAGTRYDDGEMASFKEETMSSEQLERQSDSPLVALPTEGSLPSSPDSTSSTGPTRVSSASSPDDGMALPVRVDRKQKSRADSSEDDTYDSTSRHHGSVFDDLGPGAVEAFRQGHHLVSFQTGMVSRAVDLATSQFGLHTPLGAYPVGTAECVTGGFGFLARKYGLSVDNLVEVETVTAEAKVVRCSALEEPDLFWAMHGAGTTMGIITRITSKAYPITSVYSGNMIFPFNPSTASSLIAHWRDCVKSVPNDLYANLILTAGPPTPNGGKNSMNAREDPALTKRVKMEAKGQVNNSVIVIQICFLGPRSQGEAIVQAILAWTGERCLLKDVEMRSFMEQQDSVANVLRSGAGQRFFIKSDLIDSMTDKIITGTVKTFQNILPGCAWLFELAGGAIAEVGAGTPISIENRQAKFTLVAIHQWKDPSDDQYCIDSARDWLNNVIRPQSTGGPYPCFLERLKPFRDYATSTTAMVDNDEEPNEQEFHEKSSEETDRLKGCFGPKNLDRLQKIKNQYDPENLFRFTFGLSPYRDQPVDMTVSTSSS